MGGGNEASAASGITQFAEGEPKRRNYDTVRVYQPLKGGNGVRFSERSYALNCAHTDEPALGSPLPPSCPAQPLRPNR